MANETYSGTPEQLQIDEAYMRRAIQLALRGSGWVNPNPLVGAVVVKDGRIIGQGWHRAYGEPHAERHALANCTEDAKGATIYVTLEPCCHTGKQPPCTDALIEAGIARVVMGAYDPNPKVSGGGIAQLEEAGIEVVQGVLVEECELINQAFLHYIQTGKPYVTLKYAMTLDGKIATRSGKSKWITGEAARRRVHEDRQRNSAIMVGVGTVLKDDPMLTTRLEEFEDFDASADEVSEKRYDDLLELELQADEAEYEAALESSATADAEASGSGASVSAEQGLSLDEVPLPPFTPQTSNPIRIICDTHLKTPLDSNVVKTACSVPTIIATSVTNMKKHMPYREADCDIVVVPEAAGHLDLEELMVKLGQMKIDSVIVEGGAEINWSVLAFEVVSKVQAYIAPKMFGGADAPSPVKGFGVEAPEYAIKLSAPEITRLGDDLLLECEVL